MLTMIARILSLIASLVWIYYLCGLYNKCFVKLHDEETQGVVAMGMLAEFILIVRYIILVITG